jgi:hypothetical protein
LMTWASQDEDSMVNPSTIDPRADGAIGFKPEYSREAFYGNCADEGRRPKCPARGRRHTSQSCHIHVRRTAQTANAPRRTEANVAKWDYSIRTQGG